MNMVILRTFFQRLWHGTVKNAPHILMGLGTATGISAVISAAKVTPQAWNTHADAVVKKTMARTGKDAAETEWLITSGKEKPEKLTVGEKIQACGKFYIPAISLELLSLLCFWSAHGIDVRRQAILAGLYSTAEEALREYQKKVQDTMGKEAEREVRTAIAQDHVDRDPNPIMAFEADADVWCRYKGYKFRSNYNRLKEIQNEANQEMIKNLYFSERELLWMFDPDHKWIVPDSDSGHLGWNVDNLLYFDILPTMNADHTPGFEIDILDKDGRRNLPQAGYSAAL